MFWLSISYVLLSETVVHWTQLFVLVVRQLNAQCFPSVFLSSTVALCVVGISRAWALACSGCCLPHSRLLLVLRTAASSSSSLGLKRREAPPDRGHTTAQNQNNKDQPRPAWSLCKMSHQSQEQRQKLNPGRPDPSLSIPPPAAIREISEKRRKTAHQAITLRWGKPPTKRTERSS